MKGIIPRTYLGKIPDSVYRTHNRLHTFVIFKNFKSPFTKERRRKTRKEVSSNLTVSLILIFSVQFFFDENCVGVV